MIRAFGVQKWFGGKRALGPVSFEIARGETVGFLGLNGAGKTTLLRILAGELRPSGGTLEVGGTDAMREPLAVRKLVGFLPEFPPLYPDMTVRDYLRFAGMVRGMDGATLQGRLEEVEALVGLGPVREELTRTLSQGFRQRVGFAQAIIHEPELLVLDEPAHDLDPAQIVEMRSLLHTLEGRHTILLSSHNLPEISETCDRLFVLDAGEVIASGSETELASHWLDTQQVEVALRAAANDLAPAVQRLRSIEAVRNVTVDERDGNGEGPVLVVECSDDCRAEICRLLVEDGWDMLRLVRSRRKLESIFLGLVHGTERTRRQSHSAA
ncbi:MAG: ABC transporter ATP-binding protein [Gemmatimonadota bacterium]|nr:ABC transporter ATP-binding protein [Gemmatimonadota bacterium]